jgi:DNA-directed RNA polymerase subunit RPC12/RpoP
MNGNYYENDFYVQCSHCKNKHVKSARVYTAPDEYGMRALVCPACGGRIFSRISETETQRILIERLQAITEKAMLKGKKITFEMQGEVGTDSQTVCNLALWLAELENLVDSWE